uniref:Uncharacterized protein n=1 Tax=Palpitomonas bilix TaxID=652834 RepID=A0A7S3GF10_9EUKA
MALAEQRAMLEQLMQQLPGADPNANKSFEDEDVCKPYLCGLCPREVFTNTKMDFGPCDKLHNDDIREKYLAAKKEGKRFRFEIEFEREIEKIVNDCDRRIKSSEKRVNKGEESAPVVAVSEAEKDPAVMAIAMEIEATLAEAEKKGEEGDVDESMRLNDKVKELELKKMVAQGEALKKLMPAESKEEEGESEGPSRKMIFHQQKLRVCDICGAFLSATDSDKRLADHFGGKLHIGYLQVRNKVEEVKVSALMPQFFAIYCIGVGRWFALHPCRVNC